MQDALLREDAEAYDADRDGTEGHPFKSGEVRYYHESSEEDMKVMEPALQLFRITYCDASGMLWVHLKSCGRRWP